MHIHKAVLAFLIQEISMIDWCRKDSHERLTVM